MMLVSFVWHFDGQSAVPPQLRGTKILITPHILTELYRRYDVMIHHPDRSDPEVVCIGLDTMHKRFAQR